MEKFTLIIDTNIWIDDLRMVVKIHNHDFHGLARIAIPKIILDELDYYKRKDSALIQKIIEYILCVKTSNKIEFEGLPNPNHIEVVIDKPVEAISEKNNDDHIINFSLAQENPIIITRDRMLCTRALVRGIRVIDANGSSTEDIITKIEFYINNKTVDIKKEVFLSDLIEKNIVNTIRPRIMDVLFTEFGPVSDIIFQDKKKLADLLKIVIENFGIFSKKIISKYSFRLLKEFHKKLTCKDIEYVNKNKEKLCIVFGVQYDSRQYT